MGIDWGLLAVGMEISGVGLIAWALFGDLGRKRRRCVRCWYDLSHTHGMTCSECGHTARTEGDLTKPRRRWRWVAVGFLTVVSGYGVGVAPRVAHSWDGWPGAIPTTLFIALEPWLGDDVEGPLRYELSSRAWFTYEPMWSWQRAWLNKRCESVFRRDTTGSMRVWAAGVLAITQAEASSSAPVLIQALQDNDPNVRAAAASALGAIRGNSRVIVALLIDLLNDPSGVVRGAVAFALWKSGCEDEAAIPALRRLVKNDPLPGVRVWSAFAMSGMAAGRREGIDALAAEFEKAETSLRLNIVLGLDKFGPDEGVMSIFVAALKDSDTNVQIFAKQSVVEKIVPALINMVEDGESGRRDWAIHALAAIGPSAWEAVPVLSEISRDESELGELRELAEHALERIESGD